MLFKFFAKRSSVFFALCFAAAVSSYAQDAILFDTNYVRVFPDYITGRLFLSQKYTSLRLQEPGSQPQLVYRANTPYSPGIGATYKALTINIAAGVIKDKAKGESKSLDLLSRVYTRKFVADLFGQFYKGYHITDDDGYGTNNPKGFYVRPDIRQTLLGIAGYRVLNSSKFSYRASFLQSEWQQKSAGSFLFGGEAYYGIARGDSALLPGNLNSVFTQDGVKKIRYFEIGPGIGYIHTLVLAKHLFLTASGTVTADLNYTKEFFNNSFQDEVNFSPNLGFKGAAGYNSDKWTLSVIWLSNSIRVNGTENRDDYFVRAGNYRVTYARRFLPGPKLKRMLRIVEKIPYK